MSKAFTAPSTIHRVAARRIFTRPDGKPVVLTLGVPRRVPGSDWGCALQITGVATPYRRPKYIFGIDALQSLELALHRAGAVLDGVKVPLVWLDGLGTLGMPRFLPLLPEKAEQDRIMLVVEREVARSWARLRRRRGARGSGRKQTD